MLLRPTCLTTEGKNKRVVTLLTESPQAIGEPERTVRDGTIAFRLEYCYLSPGHNHRLPDHKTIGMHHLWLMNTTLIGVSGLQNNHFR